MDKAKKKRKTLRASATKIVNEIKDDSLCDEDLSIKVETLKKIESDLEALNEKILDLMLDGINNDDACTDEVEHARLVTEELRKTRRTAEKKLSDNKVQVSGSVKSVQGSVVNTKLPKITLEKFELCPSNWLSFWSQFQRIHDSLELTKVEKFQYLRMCLVGKAKKVIDTYPNTEDNYQKAIDHITSRYGREDLIVNDVYKDLISLVRSQPSVSELFDVVSAKVRCLESFGLSNDQVAILVPLVVDCLPLEARKIWERRVIPANEDKFEALLKFLGVEAETEERINASKSVSSAQASQATKSKATASALVSTTVTSQVKCIFCGDCHLNKDCTKEMTPEARREVVKGSRCCFACLMPGHSIKFCRTKVRCSKCMGRHRELCCLGKKENGSTDTTKKEAGSMEASKKNTSSMETPKNDHKSSTSTSMFAGQNPNETVVLQTLLAKIGLRKVRILLDSGSHRSYVSARLCQEIQPKKSGEETFKHQLFGGQISDLIVHNVFEITLQSLDGTKEFTFNGLQQEEICGTIPTNKVLTKKLVDVGIELSDDGQDRPIDVLLGADVMARLVIGVRSVETLLAFETKLGWCLVGSMINNSSNCMSLAMLNVPLPTLWDLEVLGIEKPANKHSAMECIEHFKNNVRVDQGHYSVALPWIEGHPTIPSEIQMAENRLKQLLKRLERNNLYEAYDAVLHEWASAGFIEQIDDSLDDMGHYLPHRPIIKTEKTTKIRPVFDASAKAYGNVSINECLHTGPNMISNILSLLLNFRTKEIGIIADIRQAFLMIRLHLQSDQNMLRFLWWRDDRVIVYRHCRVVFGLSSSPFLLNATIQHHLKKVDGNTAHILRESFYVDDCVTSQSSMEEAENFKKEATEIMAIAGFELRGWKTSGDAGEHKVLGIRWSSDDDTIGVCKPTHMECFSKRELLSIIGRIYDPLGIVAAPLLYLKLLLHECFKLKILWDEPLPNTIKNKVDLWLNEIDLIEGLMIPRHTSGGQAAQIHTFSDACLTGLGACVFMRYENEGTHVRLVAAKARVVPSEDLTIPRKELVAATLAARLGSTVSKTTQTDVTYWSDSMIVLFWIKKGEWRTFVGNRVKEIRELSDKDQWRFVEGERNPADCVSRGCLLSEYSDWLKGPDWLRRPCTEWPSVEVIATADALNEEKTISMSNVPAREMDPELFTRVSSFKKNVRVMAYVQRFLAGAKRTFKGPLCADELAQAEVKMFKYIQDCHLDDSNLNTFKGADGLTRMKTKILADEFEACFREPIVLPPCDLIELFLEEHHKKNHHAGATTILGVLREEYWIIRGRGLMRKVIRRCVRCRRYKSKTLQPAPVGLPNNRVKLGKVFEVCGCDLAGPLFLRDQTKVWIVLFTCAVYRAVHLEIVDSLSTEAFMLALRRMVGRRGKMKIMYSDNGTNFSGTWNLIDAARVEVDMKIKWIFNVPSAPWWGGFFERMIGFMKTVLRASLGRALLDLTEMTTVLVEVEALMNSRPITYLSEDPAELQAITPSMFLQEETNVEVPELDHVDANSLSHRARYVNQVRTQLKERFRREYLGNLMLGKGKSSADIKVGDLVFIHTDSQKAVDWSLGRVVELYPGKDGVVRAVKLKTANGELLRPVQRLSLLEVSQSDFDSPVEDPLQTNEFPRPRLELSDLVTASPDGGVLEGASSEEVPPIGADPLVEMRSRAGRLIKKPELLDL